MRRFPLSVVLVLAAASPAAAQVNYDTVQIRTVKVAEGVYMLMGAGGNIGVSVGSDGVILIDDQYAPLSDKIKAAVAALGGPIRFLINTHWHWDHNGGNENFARSGVVTVAHENVRHRMSVEQFVTAFNRHVPAAPSGALPLVTFTDSVNFYLNGDSIHAFHVPPAHTDGDAIIWFRRANVVHMGDLFFNGRYPFVDLSSGGSVEGMVAAVDRVLALADGNTKIIPGHGPLADRPGPAPRDARPLRGQVVQDPHVHPAQHRHTPRRHPGALDVARVRRAAGSVAHRVPARRLRSGLAVRERLTVRLPWRHARERR